jgi:hypothetical protein
MKRILMALAVAAQADNLRERPGRHNYEIHTMDSDGQNQRGHTNNPAVDAGSGQGKL